MNSRPDLFKNMVAYVIKQRRKLHDNDILELCTKYGEGKLSYIRYMQALETIASMCEDQTTLFLIWKNCPPMRRRLLGFEGNTPTLRLSDLGHDHLEQMFDADVKSNKGMSTPMGNLIDKYMDQAKVPMAAE